MLGCVLSPQDCKYSYVNAYRKSAIECSDQQQFLGQVKISKQSVFLLITESDYLPSKNQPKVEHNVTKNQCDSLGIIQAQR